MVDKGKGSSYPNASLGVVFVDGSVLVAEGAKAGEMSRGCQACNKQEGRPSASLAFEAELPLDGRHSGKGTTEGKAAVLITVDYCSQCGRVYDVRYAGK